MTTGTTRSERQETLEALWVTISAAGSQDAYIHRELEASGHLVTRQPTEGMSEASLAAYKRSLEREGAERKRLAARVREAYRAVHVVHLGDGVFFNDDATADRLDLAEPEARAADNELPRLDGPRDLAAALGMSVPELRWLAYHRDAATTTHYTPFTLQKRDGSPRTIWAPMPKLKAAQRWILANIVERLPVHGAVHGFLAGRSIVSNARPHCGADLVVNLDLKDFFPTVTWRRVRGVFRKGGYREQVSTLLALLCTEAPREVVEHEGTTYYIALGPRVLPQGAPTSPALTNTLCFRMDRRLSGLAQKLGYRYTRYADDLTFSLESDDGEQSRVGTLCSGVRCIVADEGFVLHEDKTRLKRRGRRQQVTGIIVNGDGGPRVPREIKRRLRSALHHLQIGRPLPEGESLAKLAGLAAYIHQSEPELGRALLDALGASQGPQDAGGATS